MTHNLLPSTQKDVSILPVSWVSEISGFDEYYWKGWLYAALQSTQLVPGYPIGTEMGHIIERGH